MDRTSTSSQMSSPSTNEDIIDVCPFGNVLLKPEHNRTILDQTTDINNSERAASACQNESSIRIRVSRDVMSGTGAIFKALLQGEFKEASQHEVLVDEDAQTLLAFCRIVHHRFDQVGRVTQQLLISLTELADRRDATTAISMWMSVQLTKVLFSQNGDDVLGDVPNAVDLDLSVVDVLGFSYICKAFEPFWRASRMFLVHHSHIDDVSPVSRHILFDSTGVCFMFALLEKKRRERLDSCIEFLKKVLAPQYACPVGLERIGKLNRLVMTTTPGIFDIASGNASAMDAIKLFERANDDEYVKPYNRGCPEWNCDACHPQWKPFREVLEFLNVPPVGLCLQCCMDMKDVEGFCERLPCPHHA